MAFNLNEQLKNQKNPLDAVTAPQNSPSLQSIIENLQKLNETKSNLYENKPQSFSEAMFSVKDAERFEEGIKNYKVARMSLTEEIKQDAPHADVAMRQLQIFEQKAHPKLAAHMGNIINNFNQFTESYGSLTESTAISPSNIRKYSPNQIISVLLMSYPNMIRYHAFTEIVLSSPKDTITVMRPVLDGTLNGNDVNNRGRGDRSFDGILNLNDKINAGGDHNINSLNYRRAAFETIEKTATQNARGLVLNSSDAEGKTFILEGGATIMLAPEVVSQFTKIAVLGVEDTAGTFHTVFNIPQNTLGWEFARFGHVDGYSWLTEGTEASTDRVGALAVQHNPNTLNINQPIEWMQATNSSFDVQVTTIAPGVYGISGANADRVQAIWSKFRGEYDSQALSEATLNLQLYDITFEPTRNTINWHFPIETELYLEKSFDSSIHTIMASAAADEIRKALDINAVGMAYAMARQNGAAFNLTFDIKAPLTVQAGESDPNNIFIKATQIINMITTVANAMYNKLQRGDVNQIIAGPDAVAFLQTLPIWNTDGAMPAVGLYRAGALGSIPVYKVPATLVPANEMLLIFKNEQDLADNPLIAGVLLPLSMHTVQLPNHQVTGSALHIGDTAIPNRWYLGTLTLKNLPFSTRVAEQNGLINHAYPTVITMP